MRYALPLTAVLLLLSAIACVHDSALPAPTPGPTDTLGGGDTTVNTCSPDTVYFQRDVLPLLVSNCAMSGCHDDATHAEGIRLTSYANAVQSGVKAGNASGSKLYKSLIDSDPEDRMPQGRAPLSADQIAVIQKWINQGAKDLTCTSSGCDTTSITYTSRVKSLMSSTCTGCHNASLASGGVRLTTYAEVKAVAQSGQLYGVVSQSGGYVPMPPSGTGLNTCQQNMIKAWVNQGTPE